MTPVCILTDSSVQFTDPQFEGRELVKVLPLGVRMSGKVIADGARVSELTFPISARNGSTPRLEAPTVKDFRQALLKLGKNYQEVLLILLSGGLSEAVTNAQIAANTLNLPLDIHIIDSQNISAGLGMLVQVAAQASRAGATIAEIQRLVVGLIPRLYSLFCVRSLTYLAQSGQLEPDQAFVGEMLRLTPFLILENGRLASLQKAQSQRQIIDLFHEFLAEFKTLQHVALLHGASFDQEARLLHEHILANFPGLPLSEHVMGVSHSLLLGPRCLGLVAMQQ
jgi:DegV family protein with EDD domain